MEAGRSPQQRSDLSGWLDALDPQVAEEINRLERLRPRLMKPDDGRDLLSAVNAQLRVLQEGLDVKQVVEIWGENDACINPTWYVTQEAAAASRWLLRSVERARMKPPSLAWEPYLIERRKGR